MPSPIEQALITLVPSINSLPAELVNLATALLSQSKSKALKLKKDEEVARIYACAHIACERFRSRLGLDKLIPQPPVHKTTYNKLHAFLSAQLTATPTTPRTPRHHDALTPTSSSRKRPQDSNDITPSHRAEKRLRPHSAKALANEVATLSRSTPPPSLPQPSGTASDDPLALADGMLARLSRAFSPSVSLATKAGLSAVLAVRGWDPSPSPAPEALTASRLPALLVALALLVAARQGGRALGTDEFRSQRARAVDAVRSVPEGWVQSDERLLADVKGFLKAATEERWVDLPWFLAVEVQGEEMAGREVVGEKTPLRRKEKHALRPVLGEENAAGLRMGLGTMFQDAVDWLSEERREAYREWREDVLRRIEQMEKVVKSPATGKGGKQTVKATTVTGQRVPGF